MKDVILFFGYIITAKISADLFLEYQYKIIIFCNFLEIKKMDFY